MYIYIYIYIIYIYNLKRGIKFSGIPVKRQTVWKNPWKYISVVQIYFYCIFVRKKVSCRKNGCIEFHHFMKKE